jgi:hypothetical protein
MTAMFVAKMLQTVGKFAFRPKTGSLRANFRDWLTSDRSKRAKVARKLDYSTWHPSFHTVWLIFAPLETRGSAIF